MKIIKVKRSDIFGPDHWKRLDKEKKILDKEKKLIDDSLSKMDKGLKLIKRELKNLDNLYGKIEKPVLDSGYKKDKFDGIADMLEKLDVF
jgi:hypothetical protein